MPPTLVDDAELWRGGECFVGERPESGRGGLVNEFCADPFPDEEKDGGCGDGLVGDVAEF